AAPPSPHTTNPYHRLRYLSAASASRAHLLKHHNPSKNPASATTTVAVRSLLSPQSYGGYTVSLGFGTPPQNLSFLLDTALAPLHPSLLLRFVRRCRRGPSRHLPPGALIHSQAPQFPESLSAADPVRLRIDVRVLPVRNPQFSRPHTPFRKITGTQNPTYEQFYYVTLRKIWVGGADVQAPYEYLVPDSAGNGGTIVDSGTTFTFMEGPIFELVAREFERQNYSRAAEAKAKSGGGGQGEAGRQAVFSGFRRVLGGFAAGGAELVLPVENYFSFVEESVAFLTINTDSGGDGGPGSTIILGKYQMQNVYMEFDLENERLGWNTQRVRDLIAQEDCDAILQIQGIDL
ncbi:eukaryotic aspartyl protease family protein, partial [Striga asiatica]